jgi:tRNA 2-thiouridine synthesizing protein A
VSDPIVLDARGQRCPLPVIALARRARDLDDGARLIVLADDPAAQADIPAWCRLKGHGVRPSARGDHTAYEVVVGGAERP